MATPQTNATLTAVYTAGGETDDPSAPTDAPGAAKWTGSAGCYMRERRRRADTQSGVDMIVERTLIVDGSDPAGVAYAAGDVLAVTYRGQQITVEAADVSAPEPPDPGADQIRAAGAGTVRIYLRT